jgi:5-methylcytosine-specific restriction endonuclease McrA
MATWLELLDDQRWQIKKNHILLRDNHNCQNPNCKSKPYTSVQVHHLYYFPSKMPWEYTDDMLLTLCKPCHELELQRNRAEWHMLQTLKSKGFLIGDLLALSVMADTDQKFTQTLLDTLRDFQNG